MKRFFGILFGSILVSFPAGAQTGPPEDLKELKELIAHSKIIGPEGMILTDAVPGAPYSAEEVNRFNETLADGTHIQREDRVTVYRDSQGRLRRDTPTRITIVDPVAGVGYSLDPKAMTGIKMTVHITRTPGGEIATAMIGSGSKAVGVRRKETIAIETHKGEGPAQGAVIGGIISQPSGGTQMMQYSRISRSSEAGGGTPSNITANTESLGSQSVEGVLCQGTRSTETIPAGAIGNDRPIQTVVERWYSPELKTVVLSTRTDPRNGDETFRLTNIKRADPNPGLFQPPAGYQLAQ